MKWFDKWFAKKCKQAWENGRDHPVEAEPAYNHKGIRNTIGRLEESKLASQGVNFTMYQANGGTVVELRNYNVIHDRHESTLYVIPAEADLGQQLSHIVTIEALKR